MARKFEVAWLVLGLEELPLKRSIELLHRKESKINIAKLPYHSSGDVENVRCASGGRPESLARLGIVEVISEMSWGQEVVCRFRVLSSS